MAVKRIRKADEKTENHVKCPNCGSIYFKTTKEYVAKEMAHPGMIEMLEPWKSWGWENGFQDRTGGIGDLFCPGCGSLLAPDGKLTIQKKVVK